MQKYPASRQIITKNGPFYVYEQGGHLDDYLIRFGEFLEGEHRLFKALLQPGFVALDVGANIGLHTRNLSTLVGEKGKVYACEPQPAIRHVLSKNIKLNHYNNTTLIPYVIGMHDGTAYVPELHLNGEKNRDALVTAHKEKTIKVPVKRLVDMVPNDIVHFMRVHVKGMEEDVLRGAEKLIKTSNTILYCACDRQEKATALICYILSLGYRVYWHVTSFIEHTNNVIRGHDEIEITDDSNHHKFISINILCLPKSIEQDIPLIEATYDNIISQPHVKKVFEHQAALVNKQSSRDNTPKNQHINDKKAMTSSKMTSSNRKAVIKPMSVFDKALQLFNNHQPDDARHILLAMDGTFSVYHWLLLGMCYRALKHYYNAWGCYQHIAASIDEHPDSFKRDYYNNMANLCELLHKNDEALYYCQQAMAIEPDNQGLKLNYGRLLRQNNQFVDAIEYFKQVPDKPESAWEIAYANLFLGYNEQSLKGFERRFELGEISIDQTIVRDAQLYYGGVIAGKKLLVIHEQGFGDTIMMARFLPILKEKTGAEITFLCQPSLARLLNNIEGCTIITERLNEPYDYYVYMMSLLERFNITAKTIPAIIPLTKSHDYDSNIVTSLLNQACDLKIGFAWQGSSTNKHDEKRSVDIKYFIDLAMQTPNIEYVSFHKGKHESERNILHHQHLDMFFNDMSPHLHDFSSSAAMLDEIDIVVTIDTAFAHLAASLGKPVITLLCYRPYWIYYPQPSNKTVWYPSMRLISQPTSGDWASVFTQLHAILNHIIKAKKKRKNTPTSKQYLTLIDNAIKATAASNS